MKIFLIIILYTSLMLQFCACNQNNDGSNAENSSVYKIITFEKKSGNCDSSQAPCAEIRLKYPLITHTNNAAVTDIINKDIINSLLAPYNEDKSFSNMDSMANDFLDSFEEFRKEFPESHQKWSIERNITVENVNDSIISLANHEFYYMGGAHPNSTISFINFDLNTGKAIELAYLFKPNYEQTLNKIGEEIFREKQKLKSTESLTEAGFWFDQGSFELNDNFLIKDSGLLFLFNPYEVAAYAVGKIDILIPYSDIKNLFKDNSLLKMYLKK